MCPLNGSKTTVRIDGKRVERKTLAKEIFSLLKGTSERRPYPVTVTDVSKILGISRETIYVYIRNFRDESLPMTEDGRLCIPKSQDHIFRQFNKFHKITTDPLVSEWFEDLITRKSGNPLASWRNRLLNLENVCNVCRVAPSDLLVSNKNTEKILRQYVQQYRQDQENGTRPKNSNHDVSAVVYHKAQAIRDFCGFHGMIWKRGVRGVMSQRVPNHGLYSDIRLSPQDFEDADRFIKERWGLDSDIFRWFWVGVESCARFRALYDMTLDYTKHVSPKTNKITYVMTVYESKTKDIRGGKWYKYITRSDTQKSIDLLKNRGGVRIHESKERHRDFSSKISALLCEIYRHIGKSSPYFFKHPTHALRHIGAHYWLAKKDYNFGLVSEIGGWNTMDELKKSYGLIPPEKILEIIEE